MKQKTKDTRFSATARTARRLALASLTACAAMLLGACSEENTLTGGGDDGAQTPVTLVAGIQQAAALPRASSAGGTGTPHTRTATGADGNVIWTEGDAVGVFMLRTMTFDPADIYPGCENVRYTVDPATGSLTADGKPICYPGDDEEVDFFAYYPLGTKGDANISDDYFYTLSVTDQSDPASLDVLYANARGKKKSKEAVELTFYHILAKIQLDITLGEGLTGIDPRKITAVTITGVPTTVTYNLLSIYGTGADDPGDIVTRREPVPSPDAAATFTALLVPHMEPSSSGAFENRRIVVTVDGTDYSGDISKQDYIWNNFLHIYPVTVQKTGVTLGTPDITPWTTNDHAPGTADYAAINGIEVVRISKGTFMMGSPDSDPEAFADEKPQHKVTLTKDFYMGKYEITAAQYADFLNAAGVAKADPGSMAQHAVDGYGEQYLFLVNQWGWTPQWNDATNRWESDGNTPMIYVTWFGAKAYADWVGGSLPTEAQWEYACRARTTTAYFFGDDAAGLGDYAWYEDYSPSTNAPHPVGKKKPNPWGLYDMYGNVWEWCSDWYGDNYYSNLSAANDPTGPNAGDMRVQRGGSWTNEAQYCRSAYRKCQLPIGGSTDVGFRVVFAL